MPLTSNVIGGAEKPEPTLIFHNSSSVVSSNAATVPSSSARTILHTPPIGGDYAMGWMVRSDGALWHNGSNTAWYAEAQPNTGAGVAAAAACNDGALANSMPAVGPALVEAAAAV